MSLIDSISGTTSTIQYFTLTIDVFALMKGIPEHTVTVTGHCTRKKAASVNFSHHLLYISSLSASLGHIFHCLSLVSRPEERPTITYIKRLNDEGPPSGTTLNYHKMRLNAISTAWPDSVCEDYKL